MRAGVKRLERSGVSANPGDMLALLIDYLENGMHQQTGRAPRAHPQLPRASFSSGPSPAPSWSGGSAPSGGAAPTATATPPTSAAPAGSGPSQEPSRGPVNRDTKGMSEGEKYDHYAKIIEANGGEVNANGRNVVAVRNPTDTDTNGGQGAYDDVTAVVWKDADGTKRVVEVASNTEPNASYRGSMGQDANGDGRLDQGSLQPGTYTYAPTTFKGGAAFQMNGDAEVDRDVNQDGVFGNDRGASSGGGNSMLFHVGGSTGTGSAGCQTFAPGEYDQFLAAVGGNSFTYTLVERA